MDDLIKALYKLDPGKVHVMGNIAKPVGSAYIVFTEASGKAIDIGHLHSGPQ